MNYKQRHSLLPGKETTGPATEFMRSGISELWGIHLPAFRAGEMFGSSSFHALGQSGDLPVLTGSTSATVGAYTGTYSTGGTTGVSTKGGLVFTTGTSSGNKITMQHKTLWTFASTKRIAFRARLQIHDATNAGFLFGLSNASTDVIGTPPTDGIFFRKANNAKSILTATNGNTGTENNQTMVGSGGITIDTWYDFGFWYENAPTPKGAFIFGLSSNVEKSINPATGSGPTVLPFSAADLANVAAIANPLNWVYAVSTGTGSASTMNLLSAVGTIEF